MSKSTPICCGWAAFAGKNGGKISSILRKSLRRNMWTCRHTLYYATLLVVVPGVGINFGGEFWLVFWSARWIGGANRGEGGEDASVSALSS